MIQLASCITEQHNWPLLLVAVFVCTAGNLAGIFMLSRARQCVKAHTSLWLIVAGVVLGGTIWATHFIAMLSYNTPVSYQALETGSSIVVAIVVSCFATFTFLYVPGLRGNVAAGILLGLAIAAMHAIGLSAISESAVVESDRTTTLAAWIMGGAFSVGTMVLMARRMTSVRLISASLLIVCAVCSHHMLSMSGLIVDPLYAEAASALTFLDRVGLAIGVCIVSSLLIATGVAALFFDQHLTDVKGLANATFEAVVLTRADRIVHANEQFAKLMARSVSDLRSVNLFDFLVDLNGTRGVLMTPAGRVPVEITEGIIEYRGRETSVFGLRDISERLERDRQLIHLASHDPLTGLLNRRAIDSFAEKAIVKASEGQRGVALLTLDLDFFKTINDTKGHAEGDLVLQRVAEVLTRSFDAAARIGRIGGDEFSVLLPGSDTCDAQQAASLFMRNFTAAFGAHDTASSLGVSIGIAIFPEHGENLDQLKHNADAALYRAKSLGKGRICSFDRFVDQQQRTRRRLEEELRGAVDAGELFLLFQPIVEPVSGRPSGYEALLRWLHPTYGVLSPAVFIEAAEESGSIVDIGRWVLVEACRQAAFWEETLFVAVNVSARQLQSANLVAHVIQALSESELPAGRLELEITETCLLDDRADVARSLEALTGLGAKLVMDDYGNGYSSIANLRRYPFTKLKVGGSYVASLEDDPVAEIVIDSALAIGKSLGLTVAIEGIETAAQRTLMTKKGPDQLQGFLFGRPEATVGEVPSPVMAPRTLGQNARS